MRGYSSVPDEGYSSVPDERLFQRTWWEVIPAYLMRGYSRNTPCALHLISTFLLLRTWKETPQLNWQHAMKLNRRRRKILLKAASNLAMDLVNLLHRSQEIRVIFLLVCFHLFLVKNSYYLNSLLETSIITVYINLISKNDLYQRL